MQYMLTIFVLVYFQQYYVGLIILKSQYVA